MLEMDFEAFYVSALKIKRMIDVSRVDVIENWCKDSANIESLQGEFLVERQALIQHYAGRCDAMIDELISEKRLIFEQKGLELK